jgi:hypothetical protein
MKKHLFLSFWILALSVNVLFAQEAKQSKEVTVEVQSYDRNYVPPVPYRPSNSQTVVYIDAAHNNFHTKDQRFKPFANLLLNDGYVVESFTEKFDVANLAPVKVLVISNPANDANHPESNWVNPIVSAFSDNEIEALVNWVGNGGSLLLIADHYPFPGAVAELAARFGFTLDNGYNFDPDYYTILKQRFFELPIVADIMQGKADPNDAVVSGEIMKQAGGMFMSLGAEINTLRFWNSANPSSEPEFQNGDGSMQTLDVMRNGAGSQDDNAIPYVTTFTGHSFTARELPGMKLHPILRFGDGPFTVLTEAQDAYFGKDANASNQNTMVSLLSTRELPDFVVPVVDASNNLQAAIVEHGKGRVAFFGEAGMFTAQIAADGATKMGMNSPLAEHNWKFVLNLMRYLDGYKPSSDTRSDRRQ